MSRIGDFVTVTKELGWKHLWLLFGSLLAVGVFRWLFGAHGLYAALACLLILPLVWRKEFFEKTLSIGGQSIRFVWVALVAVASFLFLSWVIGTLFGGVATGPIGLIVISTLSVVLALRYSQAKYKGVYHSFAIFVCSVYLLCAAAMLIPEKMVDTASRTQWMAQAKEYATTLTVFSGGVFHNWTIGTRREDLHRRYSSEEPEEFTLIVKPASLDVLDDLGSPLDMGLETGKKILVRLEEKKDFHGLRYVYFYYFLEGTVARGWIRYGLIKQIREKNGIAASTPDKPTSPSQPQAHAEAAHLPKANASAISLSPLPKVDILETETIDVTHKDWRISRVAAIGERNVIYYGPFDSYEEGSEVMARIDGGSDILTLEPYELPSKKYMARITWIRVGKNPQFAWVKLKDGATPSPRKITLWNRRPY